MATLSHLPTLFSPSSPKRLVPPLHTYHQPTICASSNEKPRARRKVRSNEDLCKDIQQFVSMGGFPEGHVPSLKELSQHGRQDLANIVRRRGYKLIREILSTATETVVEGSAIEEGSSEKQDETVQPVLLEMDQQDEKVKDLAKDVSLSSEVLVLENHLSNHGLGFNNRSYTLLESSTNASLQEKVAMFIQKGELEEVEGAETEESDQMSSKSMLITKQLGSLDSGSYNSKDEHLVSGPVNVENDDDLDDEDSNEEDQAEINHLKFMLHQKELELSRLKEQIEKEKEALSLLQTKAEKEIGKAHKLISEKDAELNAAEQSLSELQEVQIEYWGDGESVEVAGSFNGWHHRVKMDPQPLPSVIDPIAKRKS